MPPAARRPAARSGRSGKQATPGVPWDSAELAPVVLVLGSEALLAERAVERLVAQARATSPDVDVVRLDARDYGPGELDVATSPSLFAEDKLVVVDGVERCTDAFLADALEYLDHRAAGVDVVLRHGGGQRGKRLLDAAHAAGVPAVACDPITSDSDKTAFVTAELRRAGRRADAHAVRALVDAVGSDLRELAAACSQLVADTSGLIGADLVERYYGGRIEATGFRVADAAVGGDSGQAVALLRHAIATGLDPVPIVAALALKLRTLAKVAAVRGRGQGALREIGLAPWQVDRAMSDLRRWTPEGLAVAIGAVAQADAEVKGEGRDPVFAVERAVLAVAGAAGR